MTYNVSERVALALARDAGISSSRTISGERDLNIPGRRRRIYWANAKPGSNYTAHAGTPYAYVVRHADDLIPDILDAVSDRLGVTIVVEPS